VQARGWRIDGRKRVGRLYIAAIVEGMEAGVDGATPMSANAQQYFEGGGGGSVAENEWGTGAVENGCSREEVFKSVLHRLHRQPYCIHYTPTKPLHTIHTLVTEAQYSVHYL
jgi:hypothetical protein